MRGSKRLLPVATQIPVAEIIGEHVNDVGLLGGSAEK